MMFYDMWMGGLWMHIAMWSLGNICEALVIYYSLIKLTISWYVQQWLMHEVILFWVWGWCEQLLPNINKFDNKCEFKKKC
jgi:hypothetical protein